MNWDRIVASLTDELIDDAVMIPEAEREAIKRRRDKLRAAWDRRIAGLQPEPTPISEGEAAS